MKKLKFIFGNHCHQPVGNFDHVFQMAVDKSYLPFLDILGQFPEIKMSMHFSGCLLEWLEDHQPSLVDDLAKLANKGQIELLSGGFYEPVLAAIPSWDRKMQLELMNSYIQRRFAQKAKGAWLTERVWESQILDSLVEADLEYLVIDDYHFKCAGLKQEEIKGYYLTENNGKPVAVFPISEELRYTIPFGKPEETITILRDYYEKGHELVVMIDDGEKFGMWPGTYKRAYTEGWVKQFFTVLLENRDWLELATPTDIIGTIPASGTIYLPSASYFEMSEWSLPGHQAQNFAEIIHELKDNNQLERFRPFLRGGIWRNFLTKYPEANNMHKHVLWLSQRLNKLSNNPETVTSKEITAARKHLLTAQCNCAYWHGVFGGLYLPHLRDAIYKSLINAEQELDEAQYPGGSTPPLRLADINCDGKEEAILSSSSINVLITPVYGGAVYELDFIKKSINLLNTLAARKEGYHSSILKQQVKPAGEDDSASIHSINRPVDETLRDNLNYIWHNRYAFIDHFLSPDTDLQGISKASFREYGDFVNQPYQLSCDGDEVLLQRSGNLFTDNGILPLEVKKIFRLEDNMLEVRYSFETGADKDFAFIFAPELNFSMLGGADTDIKYYSENWTKQKMNSSGIRKNTMEFGINDSRKGIKINLAFSEPASIWYFPASTVSQSESGFELNYQSSVLIPHLHLNYSSLAEKEIIIKLQLEEK